jgi:Flp pilus assembly protein TadD
MVRVYRFGVALMAAALLWAGVCMAQEPVAGQTPASQPGNADGQLPGGGREPRTPFPGQDRQPQTQEFPDAMPRVFFLSGRVRLADGTPPPAAALIERVCNGVVRPETYTDSKGNFSFQLGGQNPGVFMDASVGSDPFSADTGLVPIGGRGLNERDILGCEIRANLPGFLSDSITLVFRGTLDDPDIGIIHLRRLEKVEGFTFSVTTAQASKDARRAYEKALDEIKKRKWLQAEKELVKAVKSHPKYAVAWNELGRVYQQQNKLDDATRAYGEAILADSKFISPYGQLALLAVFQQKWEEAVEHTSKMLKLNPYVGSDIYFYSALAHYNMQNVDVAWDHAQEAAKLDKQRKNPRINYLLGALLAQKGDYEAAAENLRIYLQLSPNAPDRATVEEHLTAIEQRIP